MLSDLQKPFSYLMSYLIEKSRGASYSLFLPFDFAFRPGVIDRGPKQGILSLCATSWDALNALRVYNGLLFLPAYSDRSLEGVYFLVQNEWIEMPDNWFDSENYTKQYTLWAIAFVSFFQCSSFFLELESTVVTVPVVSMDFHKPWICLHTDTEGMVVRLISSIRIRWNAKPENELWKVPYSFLQQILSKKIYLCSLVSPSLLESKWLTDVFLISFIFLHQIKYKVWNEEVLKAAHQDSGIRADCYFQMR